MTDDRVYLEYIRDSIELVEEYTREGRDAFTTDMRTQDAVLRRLETLADAAAHLSHELRARHPEIPWRQVTDFRNVLAHAYTEIRLDEAWNVVADDLPVLKLAVARELAGGVADAHQP